MTRILEDLGQTAQDTDPELADVDADIARARSVVKPTYKLRYKERALALERKPKGTTTKLLARSCGDWLAVELIRLCNTGPKGACDIERFKAILEANGVDHTKWNNTSKGWQGRFRMTGRLALQKAIADEEGLFFLPDSEPLKAPRAWVAKHTH